MANKTKNIRCLGTFENDLKRLKPKVSRLDEYCKGAEEILCRDPRIGKHTKNKGILGLPMRDLPGNPKLVLYYAITKEEILFLFIGTEGDQRPRSITM